MACKWWLALEQQSFKEQLFVVLAVEVLAGAAPCREPRKLGGGGGGDGSRRYLGVAALSSSSDSDTGSLANADFC